MSLQVRDLAKAKEEAKRQGWDDRLPGYDAQTEELAEVPPDGEGGRGSPGPGFGAHLKLTWADECDGVSEEDPDDTNSNMFLESEDLDDEEVEDPSRHSDTTYLLEGEATEAQESGQTAQRIREVLQASSVDVKQLGARRVEVDLTFLADRSVRARTLRAMEELIKVYTSIPGRVETTVVSDKGVYCLNVTNDYLSPASDPSESSAPAPRKGGRGLQNQTVKPILQIYPELVDGIKLTPKFPGLPMRIIKYEKDGLSLEGIQKLRLEGPESSRNEIIERALKLAGTRARILNLYRLP